MHDLILRLELIICFMTADIKIDLTNKESLKKWCTELKCNERYLIYAVLRIGNRVQSVDNFLILNRKKTEQFQVFSS